MTVAAGETVRLQPGEHVVILMLLCEVERQFRALMRIRSGGKARFRFLSRQTRKERRELERDENAASKRA